MRLNLLKPVPIGTIALALSIGLHGLLLGLPLPDRNAAPDQAASEPAKSETLEPIAIRPVPPPPAPLKPVMSPSPQSASKATPKATPQPALPIVRPTPQPIPAQAIAPSPAPIPSPTEPAATAPPSPHPPLSPSPQPLISPSPPLPSPAPFTTDFPHWENAQAGCFGMETCHQIEGAASFREVGRTMMEQLEAKGYTVRLRDDLEDDTGRKVYEVSKDEETQYLSVLSALELGRTVYVLAEKPMTIADLQAANAGRSPEG